MDHRETALAEQFRSAKAELQFWLDTDQRAYQADTIYPQWDSVCSTFQHLLTEVPPEDWTQDLEKDVLFTVGYDHQAEDLLGMLINYPAALLRLGPAALDYPDYHARWQVAHGLGQIDLQPDRCETLLCHFAASDPEEYVRRRALLALGTRPYPSAEPLALAAWESGHPHQRIAALTVLHQIHSPHLSGVLQEAFRDARESVRRQAARISQHFRVRA